MKKNVQLHDGFAVVLFGLGLAGIAIILASCASFGDATKQTCAAIDLAHQACATVTFLGDDGKQQTMQLTPGDVRELGRAKAAKHAGDAGK